VHSRRSAIHTEEIRAERIAAVGNPKLRQELEGIAKARDTELARVHERQKETFDGRVAELRDQKIRSANAPQLTPTGMRPPPYLGDIGHARAEKEAKAKIETNDIDYRKQVAKSHNDQIDKRLDAPRENQRAELVPVQATRFPAPNRYAALISRQNYTERAKQAELAREKEQAQTLQQQRQRGLERSGTDSSELHIYLHIFTVSKNNLLYLL
jgi:hypothetical protein